MLKKPIFKQATPEHDENPLKTPEKASRGRPQHLRGSGKKIAEPSRNINGVLQDSPNKLINGSEPATREDFLNDAGLEDFDLGGLKGEEEGEYIENKEQSKSLSNDDTKQCKKSTDFVSNRGSDLDDLGVKEEHLSSDFDSPYCGSDKYCLDILDGDPENPIVVNDYEPFRILERDFTFGNEYSPKHTLDDLSTSSLFDMEIEFSGDNKEINDEIVKKEEEAEEEGNKGVLENENKDPSAEFISALDQIIAELRASKEAANEMEQVKEEEMENHDKSKIEPKRITNNTETEQRFPTVKHLRPGLGTEEIEIKLEREDKSKKAPFKIFKMPYDLSRVRSMEEEEGRFYGRGRGSFRNSDDFERYWEHKIKKKMKVERGDGDDEKSPYSEVEYKTSAGFSSKKGSMHERYEGLAGYSEEFPRRSQREKREPPKTFENKIFGTDFGFTFVEFKQHKTEKIKISIGFRALLMMNIHAHLSTLEVIGLMGGTVISEDEIVIHEAVPCHNISESSNTHSVEMDPASQVESQEKLERMGYKTLGWYHSHPTFKSIPSQIDQETHMSHQIHYKEHHYIGVIIGPYSTERSASAKMKGEVFVFHVFNNQTYKLNFSLNPSEKILLQDLQQIEAVLTEYKKAEKTVKFQDKWRKTTSFQEKFLGCVRELLEENYQSLLLQEQQEPSQNGNGGMMEEDDELNSEEGVNGNKIKSDLPLNSKTTIKRVMNFLEGLLQDKNEKN